MAGSSNVEPLRPRLRRALLAAMKARDLVAVAALRSALAAIDNAEAVALPRVSAPRGGVIAGAVDGLGAGDTVRRDLSEGQIAEAVQAEVVDRRTAAGHYERAGRLDQAARLTAEADVLITHLGEA